MTRNRDPKWQTVSNDRRNRKVARYTLPSDVIAHVAKVAPPPSGSAYVERAIRELAAREGDPIA